MKRLMLLTLVLAFAMFFTIGGGNARAANVWYFSMTNAGHLEAGQNFLAEFYFTGADNGDPGAVNDGKNNINTYFIDLTYDTDKMQFSGEVCYDHYGTGPFDKIYNGCVVPTPEDPDGYVWNIMGSELPGKPHRFWPDDGLDPHNSDIPYKHLGTIYFQAKVTGDYDDLGIRFVDRGNQDTFARVDGIKYCEYEGYPFSTWVDGDVVKFSWDYASSLDADFSADPTNGTAPLTVQFIDKTTGGSSPYTYAWDFDNDGSVDSADPAPSYDYTAPGIYTVSLTVTDSENDVDTEVKVDYITVTEGVEMPDLIVSEKSEEWIDPSDPSQGYKVHYTVKNQGTAAAGASNTCLFIDDVSQGSQSCPALNADEEYSGTFEGPFTCDDDSDIAKVCADWGASCDGTGIVDENNETNNCKENVWSCSANLFDIRNGAGEPGSEDRTVEVWLKNAVNVAGIQVDICDVDDYLSLPNTDDIELTDRLKDQDGNPLFSLDFRDDYPQAGCVSLVLYSQGGSVIKAGDGPILILHYDVDSGAPSGEARDIDSQNLFIADENGDPLEAAEDPGSFLFSSVSVLFDIRNGAGEPESTDRKVEVCLENTVDVAGIQVDICDAGNYLSLPNADDVELTDRADEFTCDFTDNYEETGCVRLVLYSEGGSVIEAGDGPIFILHYDVDPGAGAHSCVDITSDNLLITNGYPLTAAEDPGTFFLGIYGDPWPYVNGLVGDGLVNIFDVVRDVQIILGTYPEPPEELTDCEFVAGDVPTGFGVNCEATDEEIDVSDVLEMVRKILGRLNCIDLY